MAKSIILAAGKGTRMKSETPKVLHKIYSKTLLDYVIDAATRTGYIDENYVIVGHKAELVEEHLKENYANAKAVLQSPQLGTGHAVSMACPYLKDYQGEVIILNGDLPLITADTLKKFMDYHRNSNSDITVASAVFDNPFGYGRIIRNSDGTLNSIVEEKDTNTEQKSVKEINVGMYCLNWTKVKDAFSQLKTNNAQGEYYLTDIVEWGNKNGLKVSAHIIERNEETYGINSKQNLAEATKIMTKRTLERFMAEGITIVDPDNTWIDPQTEIGADTVILPSTYIEGKNKIGAHCKIGPFSHLRGGVIIDDYVKIGNFVEVKKAHIKSHTNACHLTYIGDSEVGENVNIGAGTITANYDPLSKVKSKTVIEDNVKIGSNSVLVAPVTIEEGANVGALSVITKDVKKWSLALTRSPMKVFEGWVSNRLNK